MNSFSKIKLENLGYDDIFESERKKLGLTKYKIGRVIAEYREVYKVRGTNKEYLAKITGKQMLTANKREDYPAVGDWLALEELPENKATIIDILPRRSLLKKKYSHKEDNQLIATNVDSVFITESMDIDFNLNRLERYFVIVEEATINPIIIFNKIDLISDSELNNRVNQVKNRFDKAKILLTSSIKNDGISELLDVIENGKTYCFIGSSGVGKSTIINKLLEDDEIKTREISSSSGKGTHTTTTREMFLLKNGGIVIDNPGTREVGISDSEAGMNNVFNEINSLSQYCKFSNCSHTNEPGCAVISAVEDNKLDEDRFQNYTKLKRESEFYKMTKLEKKEKDKKFGKHIKKVLKEYRKK